MNKRLKRWLLISTFFLTLISVTSVSIDAALAQEQLAGNVLASTSWTAAFAGVATGGEIPYLAPSDLRDPREYELTPADLARIQAAEWVIYSGQESFAPELEAASRGNAGLIKIKTNNTPANIKAQTAYVAGLIGTEAQQAEWARAFDGVAARIKAEINAVFPPGTPVIAHPAQASLAHWLEFDVIGALLPTLSQAQIDALGEQAPEIVLDSYHDPVGDQAAEVVEALYVQFISFPGPDETISLADVLRYNRDLLVTYSLPAAPPSTADRVFPWLIGIGGGLLILGVSAWFLLRRLQSS